MRHSQKGESSVEITGKITSLMYVFASSLTCSLNLTCLFFELLSSSGSSFVTSRQSSMRSISSEKRPIRSNTLDKEVPPLNINILFSLSSENILSSVQTTQKSFSIMAGIISISLAVSVKSSRLFSSGKFAILSIS